MERTEIMVKNLNQYIKDAENTLNNLKIRYDEGEVNPELDRSFDLTTCLIDMHSLCKEYAKSIDEFLIFFGKIVKLFKKYNVNKIERYSMVEDEDEYLWDATFELDELNTTIEVLLSHLYAEDEEYDFNIFD